MKKLLYQLTIAALFPLGTLAQDAQFVPYRGGAFDGHAAPTLSNFTAGTISSFRPFAGGSGSGYKADSLQQFNPLASTLMFSPFVGGAANGYSADSLHTFNSRGYITMFSPFAGGIADGHFEGVICNYPKATADTTVFLPCSNNAFNLISLVENYSFAARWNTTRPDSVVSGTYELRINNAGKCLDTMQVIVQLDVATWTGATGSNWHDATNWSTNRVPGVLTHVIIPTGAPNSCIVSAADAVCASVQARTGGTIRTQNGRLLFINGRCTQLPQN
ncbi:hypothetical protein [Phnomibacter sp. MR]|uniref:hypothetical protein n=1 Tax=Phnomibacter sp. MR TaxID=3042318 RepID=UPI003A81266F